MAGEGTAVHQEIRQDGQFITVMKSGSTFKNENDKRARFGEYSLLFRRIIDTRDNRSPVRQLEIQSKSLRNAFATIASDITTIPLHNDPIIIPWPCHEIYYCRDKIKEAHEEATDEQLRAELHLLIQFQENFMQDSITMCNQLSRSKTIDFQWLWSIFPPGEPVIIENSSALNYPIRWCANIEKFEVEVAQTGVTAWIITVTHTAFNGWRFRTAEFSFRFPSFTGCVPINQLQAYPLRFADDAEDIKSKALKRGQDCEDYCLKSSKIERRPNGTPRWHEGPMWLEREYGRSDRLGCRLTDFPAKTVKGRVIVDFEGFYARSPVFRDILIFGRSKEDENHLDSNDSPYRKSMKRYALNRAMTDGSISRLGRPDTEPSLSVDQLWTMSPLVPVYSFSAREWGLVFIDQLRPITWDTTVFESLQVDENIKGAIRGLIRGFSTHATQFDDFIDGRGAGLVILLHGPPGCGKSMTAESISEDLQKPLYHISGGDLGASVNSIQKSLEAAFKIVARWDAILLLDEADAFLAKREGSDIERNSLVAVFLRLLEYQSGIIFLTTNRLGDFDHAFGSRIHVQMQFEPLDNSKREAIWTRLSERSNHCSLLPEQAKSLGKLPLNGRRIKNVLRLASLFAANRQSLEVTATSTTSIEKRLEVSKVEVKFQDIKEVLRLALASDLEMEDHDEKASSKSEKLSVALKNFWDENR